VIDNAGLNPDLVHTETIKSVTTAYPRNKWTECFASTIEKEIAAKPWCHSTAIDGFTDMVRNNQLMEPYD